MSGTTQVNKFKEAALLSKKESLPRLTCALNRSHAPPTSRWADLATYLIFHLYVEYVILKFSSLDSRNVRDNAHDSVTMEICKVDYVRYHDGINR